MLEVHRVGSRPIFTSKRPTRLDVTFGVPKTFTVQLAVFRKIDVELCCRLEDGVPVTFGGGNGELCTNETLGVGLQDADITVTLNRRGRAAVSGGGFLMNVFLRKNGEELGAISIRVIPS